MRQEDQRAIEDLFDRLENVERNSAPRDAEAEALIREKLRDNPGAAYFMAQTIIVQEAALREQQARLEQAEQQAERGRGGFLDNIFGGGNSEPRREPLRQYQQPQSERRRGPWDNQPAGGGGFLAGAAQTALGVTGGILLGSAIAGMFNTPAEAAELPPEEPQDTGTEDAGFEDNMDDGGGDFGGGDFDMGGDF
ncbi:DUF2076 domain-containing protein [Devosia rhizoryzae]|uniref:DUF2076 domain-containing protein n=2 Tax=Devosia rhizoryzae TaxID=2774137 RepID=A0ABX7CE83_9HYPH|nr:DUF2076 domain-containing protein [Devosia rhizoryzae]